MVWHQAITPDLRPSAFGSFSEQIAIQFVIAIFEEGLRPAIAALGHVMGKSRQDEARQAGRARGIPQFVYLVNWHRNFISVT